MSDSMHIVCPHCQSINRLPTSRLEQHPKCGSCHKTLFMGRPLEVDTAAFTRHIVKNDIPVLVDFWAPWCGPCRMMAPYFSDAAQKLEPHFRLIKLNTENEQQIGAQYNIRSIPTMALFLHGREIARQAGAIGTDAIIHWAQQHH